MNEESRMTLGEFGNKEWRNEKGELHRLGGPAIEWSGGGGSWYLNGELHRLNGPAIEWSNGRKEWWLNGQRHRLDGPAIEWSGGYKEWWVNGVQEKISPDLRKSVLDVNNKVDQLRDIAVLLHKAVDLLHELVDKKT